MTPPIEQALQLWSEGPLGMLAVASSGLSAGGAIALFNRAMRVGLNVEAFCDQLRKLIAANNVERAIKLCSAVPGNPLGQLAVVGLEARARGDSAMAAMQEVRPALLAALQRGLVPIMGIAGFAALAAAMALATHMQADFYPLALGLALFDAGVLVFAARAWMAAARDVDQIIRGTGDF